MFAQGMSVGGHLPAARCGAGCSLGAWWPLVQLPAVPQTPWEGHLDLPELLSSVVGDLGTA